MPIIVAPPGPAVVLNVFKEEWIDPWGVVHDLSYQSSPDLFVSRGSLGMGSPPVQITDEKLPFEGGSVPRHIATMPAKMTIPITVRAANMTALLAKIDDLRTWFDTGDEKQLRPGIYRITRADGSVRQRICLCEGGLEGDLTTGNPNETIVQVDLKAHGGWWTDGTDTTYTWTGASAWASPVGVINAGQLDAYPVWTIHGPGAGIVIQDNTTLEAWGWNGVLAGISNSLTVDTRPSSQRDNPLQVYDQAGANRYNLFVATSKLWHLAPGTNSLSILMTGATGATVVSVAYRQRYRGALR